MIDSAFEHQCRERMRILEELKSLSESRDAETAHSKADNLLIEYLRLIGANDIADAWDAVPTWYA